MKVIRNIRSKIWTCVSVALLSYLSAILATTWVNNETQLSITHIQEYDLPLLSKGILVHSLFNAQSEEYEYGVLTGEPGEITQANIHHKQIALFLDELVRLASASHNDIYPRILSLRDDYNDYFVLASQYYMEALQQGDIFDARREINQLGKLRSGLDTDFQHLSDMLQEMIVTDLEKNSQRIDSYTNSLYALFALFLLLTTFVINWFANKEIIVPLGKIKKMISDFSRGRSIKKPEGELEGDEIQELAASFWQMTRDLQHITVSRDYVDNIINNMSDSLIILHPDLTIKTVNHATLTLLHSSKEALVAHPFRTIFSHPKESLCDSLFKGLLEGKAVNNLEAFYISNSEERVSILFSASALYFSDGTLQGISCLAHDIRDLHEQREEVKFLANFDRLTGLPNRNLFFDRLTLAMTEVRRYGDLFALLYLDLDNFKRLNDKCGHVSGNTVLQEVANRLQETVRESDTVSRIGGGEFTILLARIPNANDAMTVAENILKTIGAPFSIDGDQYTLGVSIGICLSSTDLNSADNLLKNADTAMSAAKAQGRNRFILFSADEV